MIGKLIGHPDLKPSGEPVPQLPELPWDRNETVPTLVRPRLRAQGLELTQSTQFYGTGYGAVNSVPLGPSLFHSRSKYPVISSASCELAGVRTATFASRL